MKLCRNCKYGGIKITTYPDSHYICRSPSNDIVDTLDIVRGIPFKLFSTCAEARSNEYADSCGSSGKWFAPEVSLKSDNIYSVKRLKNLNKLTAEDL